MDEDILASLPENGIPSELIETIIRSDAHAPSLQQYGPADASFQGSSDDNTQQCIFSSVLLRVIYLSDCFFCEMSTDTGFS